MIYRDRRNPTLAPAYDLVATFVYWPDSEGPEPMALRFEGSKRFEAVQRSTFARLDERLGAKAELATVAETVVARVREEWPRAAALLTGHQSSVEKSSAA